MSMFFLNKTKLYIHSFCVQKLGRLKDIDLSPLSWWKEKFSSNFKFSRQNRHRVLRKIEILTFIMQAALW